MVSPGYSGKLNIVVIGYINTGMSTTYAGGYIAKNIPNSGTYSWNTNSQLASYGSQISTTLVNSNQYAIEIFSDDGIADGSMGGFFSLAAAGVTWPSVDAKINGTDSPAAVLKNAK